MSGTAVRNRSKKGKGGRPKEWDGQAVVRFTDEQLGRIDAHAARLTKETGIKHSRAAVLRMLIDRGLDAVESGEKTGKK